jgi:transcriptional regulator with XRE-family HTH domain
VTPEGLREFGSHVREARVRKGWTLEILAEVALNNPDRKGYVSQIENGKRPLSALTVGNLARVLDLPAEVTRPLLFAPAEQDEVTREDRVAETLIRKTDADPAPPQAEALVVALAYEFAGGKFLELATAYTALRGALQAAQEVKDQIARLHNMDDRLAAVLRRVDEMNDRGETDAAGQELDAAIRAKEAEIEALQDAALQQDRLRNDAASYAKRLVARLRAAAPPGGVFMATMHLLNEWKERGERKGDPFDLAVALALARINYARAKGPQTLQAVTSLGVSHLAMGKRLSGNDHLVSALNSFTDARKLAPLRSRPENWAISQNNLGTALGSLGDRERDTSRLHDAIAAYRTALKVRTREAAPIEWAATQNNLGGTLQSLAEREGDTARLHESLAAYRASLQVRTREAAPMDWADTQNNLANALRLLGELEDDIDYLQHAVATHRAVLEIRTRAAVPMDWAATQNNLGLALRWLGTVTRDTSHFDAADAALRNCLTVRTRDAAPFLWAETQWNLADLALARDAVSPHSALILQARDHLAQAREVFAEAENAHQLAKCDRLQAQIDAAEAQ